MAIRSDIVVNWESSPRIITVLAPSVNVSMQDLYDTLRSLEDDTANMDNDFIVSGSGKENLGGGVYVGLTVTLNNGQLAFESRLGPSFVQCNATGGNLVAIDSSGNVISAIYSTNYTQIILTSSSSATLQEVSEIQYASFNGGVTVDPLNGINSIVYPAGTSQQPCKTISNALSIALERGLNTFYLIGNITLSSTEVPYFVNGTLIGQGMKISTVTVNGCIFTGCICKNCKVQGIHGNGSQIEYHECEIGNLGNVSIDAHNCVLSGTIELNDTISSNFFNCVDGIPGTGTPVIQVNDCESLGIWSYTGGIKLTNIITPGTNISLNFISGRLIVDSTDTQGSIIVRGIGSLIGTTGGTILNNVGLIDNLSIENAILDASTSKHQITNTIGKTITDTAKDTVKKIIPFLFAK